ncbi:GDSL-type esterase/lipase family protein [Roseimaritima ulvae]|uniref:Multifunctional acyl-CoA thioesterase I and protease I and lysophospholipase L1 n=1 Tax=Roseimaritima ulvae TaxID=980254 RepID=A0A5B9QQL8_9BACT|nr:GDSL-type esterase/lipase family protein [Roseimaritima ulvae]QEG41397.1 multifunctional acyl-CoA thioesterase I and protease I and lysophospholipase L1 [Roseimaritima ulvae]
MIYSPPLRTVLLGCLPLLWAAMGWAAPPAADWFPQAKPWSQGDGESHHVATVEELFTAVGKVRPGDSILVADGHYRLPRYFEITTDNVTLRSASGNRDRVILDGAGSRHGELLGITGCQGVTIADLTIQNVKYNGIKLNSDRGVQRVTVHNCVLHNIWQRGVKAPGLRENAKQLSPRDCRVQFCLFYNDRPKQFSDDETDTPQTFNGNYIGGIDVKNTTNWTISDNVFIGIQGRTREGRGCIYISEDGRNCVIERNVFLNCDIGIALGNPSLEYSARHAVDCVVQNNLVSDCPETGILACYSKDCQIRNNTVFNPDSSLGRLIWVQNVNDGLQVENNLLVGPPLRVTSDSRIKQQRNIVLASQAELQKLSATAAGQTALTSAKVRDAIALPAQHAAKQAARQAAMMKPGVQRPEVIAAMRKVHQGFEGQTGYVAQFGDSITYSMAFWTPIGWDSPDQYLAVDDGWPKTPKNARWRDYVKGTRDKGPEHGNYSGWKVGQLNRAIDGALAKHNPEVAIIMIGTNDISGGKLPASYPQQLRDVVQKCLDQRCVPILNTIPPRRGHEDAVAAANQTIRDLAKQMSVPLADFHAECVRLRPEQTWDGTLISGDGVHPSGGKSNVYTPDNLSQCGYALRNWVNFLVLRQIYTQVLEQD